LVRIPSDHGNAYFVIRLRNESRRLTQHQKKSRNESEGTSVDDLHDHYPFDFA
jgi:hypothetical protein